MIKLQVPREATFAKSYLIYTLISLLGKIIYISNKQTTKRVKDIRKMFRLSKWALLFQNAIIYILKIVNVQWSVDYLKKESSLCLLEDVLQ